MLGSKLNHVSKRGHCFALVTPANVWFLLIVRLSVLPARRQICGNDCHVVDWIDEWKWTDITRYAWWRHDMETLSKLLAICGGHVSLTDGVPSQEPVMYNCVSILHHWLRAWLEVKKMVFVTWCSAQRPETVLYDYWIEKSFIVCFFAIQSCPINWPVIFLWNLCETVNRFICLSLLNKKCLKIKTCN